MTSSSRLSRALKNAKHITISNQSRIVFMSDIHRGDSSYADEFARNENIYAHALKYYYDHCFTYIELGDGNELWENRFFKSIYSAHKSIFKQLESFHEDDRLHMIWGNHDMVYKNSNTVKQHYSKVKDDKTDEFVDFMPNLEYHEALVLQHQESDKSILCLHGHQADFMNYNMWKFNRFFVQIFWKPMQILGFYDPTSPAKNHKTLIKVERRIKNWIIENENQMIISGHTHRPRFPKPTDIPFFNDGSAVHPRSITAIEINSGNIQLVKWIVSTTKEGVLKVVKEILEGPETLDKYLT
ncbi:MAG: metallophosphoesterase [Flavobacteriales bacterium]